MIEKSKKIPNVFIWDPESKNQNNLENNLN